jgi:hypothetical protein
VSEPERVFFVHLQKTAGTALLRALRRTLGPDAVYPTPELDEVPSIHIDTALLREAFAREGDRIQVVVGHYPLCTTELLGAPFRTITVLRDPLERTLSFLRHRRQETPDLAGASLEELYRDPYVLFGMIHNHMTKMLGISTEEMVHPLGMLNMVEFDDAFAGRARAGLERIDVIGLQERFDDFLALLEARFGWDLGDVGYVNRTERRDDDTSDVLEWSIRKDNALDFDLYRFAVDLVERRAAGGA